MRKPFEGIFGNTCELRILEFLLPLEGMDFNISELAEEVGVSRPTVQKVVKKFLEYGILKVSRERGGIKYYEINPESPFVKLLNELNNILIAKMVGPEVMAEVEEYWKRRTFEELREFVTSFTRVLGEMFSAEIERLPTPTELIEEDKVIHPPAVTFSARAADELDLLRGDINAA